MEETLSPVQAPPVATPAWKASASHVCAFLMAVLFLIAGVWKLTDAPGAAVRMNQALVPQALSLPAAIAFGIAETFAAILILIPRFRRWGAWLIGAMLVAFMLYFAIFYNQLRGEECSCFPWLKRAVGPGFFVADSVMLAAAAIAGWWVRPSFGTRPAVWILAAVTLFAGGAYGVSFFSQTGVRAPNSITVDGRPMSLQDGQIFVYFFDPECSHCLDAARRMAKLDWGETKVVVVPTQQQQFARSFLETTGLRAGVSNDLDVLRAAFPFVSTPAGVAIEGGIQKKPLSQFEEPEPEATLRGLGFAK
ncbi:MAG: DoxX family protein [Bryobacterales bacterium]|nr:DoxX family protein [Bryobacterales bacterium]